MIEFKKKIEKCCYSHMSFRKTETGECCRYCVKDGWDDDKIKDITEDTCENCPNYKSRFIEYPITVSDIVTEDIKYNDSWQYKIGTLCAIRPCAEEYEGKTYLGVYLGDLPISHHITHDPKTKILKVSTMDNPAIFVPDLNKIIFGCASWWHKIENIDEIKDITKEDIENTWYVKLAKNLKMNEILTKFFGKKNAQGVENMLNGNFVTAKNAYMMARHGKVCTQVDLLKTFLSELRSLIEAKSGQFEFMCMKHVEEDIVELLPVIINYLTKKLGYKCIVLDPHTTIYNNVNSQDVKSDVKLTKTTLLLFWDEADISEHLFEDVNPEEAANVVHEAAKTAVVESTETSEEPSTEEHELCSSCI